jgi:3-oxoacyl-[acyl-carrier-protein] synthase II
MTENTRRVVVTGLGLVSPVGSTIDKAWGNIKNGVSGIKKITSFDASSFSVQISGSVDDFNADDFISPKDQKKWIHLFIMVLGQV